MEKECEEEEGGNKVRGNAMKSKFTLTILCVKKLKQKKVNYIHDNKYDNVNIVLVEEFWVPALFAAMSDPDHGVLHSSESLADDNCNVH